MQCKYTFNKAKTYNTSSIPQLQRRFLYHRQSRRIHVQTLSVNQTAIRSPGTPFDGLHPCNACIYMDYYSFADTKGM